MPDHSNEATRATESKIGPYVWNHDQNLSDIIEHGPIDMDNGAIY